jgi:hypothetical protein
MWCKLVRATEFHQVIATTALLFGLTIERISGQPALASRRPRTRARRSLADRLSTRTSLVGGPDHQRPKNRFHQGRLGSPFRSSFSNSVVTTCCSPTFQGQGSRLSSGTLGNPQRKAKRAGDRRGKRARVIRLSRRSDVGVRPYATKVPQLPLTMSGLSFGI